MSPRCARVTLMLAVAPLIVGLWLGAANRTGLQVPSMVATGVALALVLATWRACVRWTIRRTTSTAGFTLALLAQVVIWRPLWDIGSCYEGYLCTAQSLGAFAFWLGLSAALWWGAAKLNGPRASSRRGRIRMTPNAVRLVFGFALLSFLPALFFISLWGLRSLSNDSWSTELYVALAYFTCACIALPTWILLWRRAVSWNRRRVYWTAALATIVFLSGGAPFGSDVIANATWEMFCGLAPLFAWSLWLAGTAFLWRADSAGVARTTGDEADSEAPRCPRCEYNLTGLHEVRCPECGWSSTIDDLLARTLARTAAVP